LQQNRVRAVLLLRVFVSVKNSRAIVDADIHVRKTIVGLPWTAASNIAPSFSQEKLGKQKRHDAVFAAGAKGFFLFS
jgi:hypothetical protein